MAIEIAAIRAHVKDVEDRAIGQLAAAEPNLGAGAECYIWRPDDWDEIVAKLEFNTKEAT